jgi:hypothetical protein
MPRELVAQSRFGFAPQNGQKRLMGLVGNLGTNLLRLATGPQPHGDIH